MRKRVTRRCGVRCRKLYQRWGMKITTRPFFATGSRHRTLPADAGCGGHHTTVDSLFFAAHSQTRVPSSFCARPVPSHAPQPHVSTDLPEKPLDLPKFTNPNPIIPRSQISRPRNVISDTVTLRTSDLDHNGDLSSLHRHEVSAVSFHDQPTVSLLRTHKPGPTDPSVSGPYADATARVPFNPLLDCSNHFLLFSDLSSRTSNLCS